MENGEWKIKMENGEWKIKMENKNGKYKWKIHMEETWRHGEMGIAAWLDMILDFEDRDKEEGRSNVDIA